MAQKVEHLLRAADGERGDDDVAAAVERALQHFGEGAGVVEAHLFVEAVAVGGLDDKHIGTFHALRVAQKGLVRVAHVAAEDHLALRVALAQPQFDGRGAEQMADVRKAYLHAFQHGQALAIAAGAQKVERALGVFQVVDRLHGRAAGALGLARLPFRVRDLYVGAVAQHDLQKVAGLLRGVDGAAEAALVEQRQVAGMVDVGVRDEDAEQRLGLHGKGLVFKAVCALFHAAIDEEGAVVDGQKRLAAGDFMGGAEKFHAHVFTLLCVHRPMKRS